MYINYCAWTCVISLFLQVNTVMATVTVVNFEPSVIPNEEVVAYFKTFFKTKASTFNKENEEFYTDDKFSEDLFHRIDNLMPTPVFLKLFVKTKNITDKTGVSSNSYPGELNAKCDPNSVFNTSLSEILKRWEGNKIIAINELEDWHSKNKDTPNTKLCNRFRGLTCQFKRALDPELDQGKSSEPTTDNPTCQCAGDGGNVGFFKSSGKIHDFTPPYPEGCYVRLWKPCKLLSRDSSFSRNYYEWHHNYENERSTLAQMVFPVSRIHRCKEGTHCVDMIPGMKKPVCWCSVNSEDPSCQQMALARDNKRKVPWGGTLDLIRTKFAKLIIPAGNSSATCNPDYNDKVRKLVKAAGKDPTVTRAVDIMEEMVHSKENIKICDFREALTCDEKSRSCRGDLNCDPGKIHLGMGVCAANNGFACQTNEECVQNARCIKVAASEASHCVCSNGYYGSKCTLQKAAFFGSRFLPIVSGFEGNEFISLQVEINQVLESWEDAMRKQVGESCDFAAESLSMQLVEYFGSLERFDKQNGLDLIKTAKQLAKDSGGRMCQYKKFLRCDKESRECVPMHGSKILSTTVDMTRKMNVLVEVEPEGKCSVEFPRVFEGVVSLVCTRGYTCKKHGNAKICVADCNSSFAPRKLCPSTTTPLPLDDEDKKVEEEEDEVERKKDEIERTEDEVERKEDEIERTEDEVERKEDEVERKDNEVKTETIEEPKTI